MYTLTKIIRFFKVRIRILYIINAVWNIRTIYMHITGKKPLEIGHIKCAQNVPGGTMCPISICALFEEKGHNVPYLCALFL